MINFSRNVPSGLLNSRSSDSCVGLELLELQDLKYPRLSIGFDMLLLFTTSSLMEFQVGYLTLFNLFSVIDGFAWKNIQLILEFRQIPFLVLRFSCHILMTLVVLSVILLSMLRIVFSTLSESRHLICGKNQIQLLSFNLIYKTLQTGGRTWFVDLNAGKNQLILFERSINTGVIDVKMDGSFLEKKSFLKCWG